MKTTDRRTAARTIVLGITASAAVTGIGLAGVGAASAAPQSALPLTSNPETTTPATDAPGTYTKKFVSRYYPTPQSAIIGAQINLYLFNSVRLNGNQACSEQPNPVVKLDKPVGWTATVTAVCLTDAGTGRSAAPVGQ